MSRVKNILIRAYNRVEKELLRIDQLPLWWLGLIIAAIFFLPYFILGKGCIFEINDQLDESIMNYILPARHFLDGSNVYPEMLGGVNASGMQPSAILFLPLYILYSPRIAFLLQYIICFLIAFAGMYLLVKESTQSSILAVIAGSCFCVLPLYPIYGLTEFGIPLVIYAFLCFWKRKRFIFAVLSTLLFGLTSHLVCTGYVVLGLWLLAIIIAVILKRKNSWPLWGFGELLLTYMIVNRALILEILIGNSSYVSHREEMISSATPFFETFRSVFLNSSQHAPSLHKYLILPIILFLILGAFCKKEETDRILYKAAVINFLFLIAIALFYAFCHLTAVVEWKNNATGFLHYFQMHRVYWLYPAAWYLEFAWAAAVLWRTKVPHTDARMQAGKLAVINGNVEKITGIVTTINEVSRQTNLLSLNASIEAEKAGEFGLGFAVVARQIRRLADKTSVASANIENIVRQMQSSVNSGVMEMDRFGAKMRQSSKIIMETADMLARTVSDIEAIGPQFEGIASGIGELSENARRISATMLELSDSSVRARDRISEFRAAVKSLDAVSVSVLEAVARFKIDGGEGAK